ncbi:MAG: hypothetical protein ABIK89_09245, partial [Planctomycetota bacterium]
MKRPESASAVGQSRRKFLRAGILGVGAWAAAAMKIEEDTVLAAERAEQGFIDAHVHVWTPDTERYPLASGHSKEKMALASFTPEELFAHARPCGVTRIVLIQMSYYGFDNSYMLDMM